MLIQKKAQKKILDQQFCVFYFCSSTKRVENGRAGGPFVVLLAFMWPPLFSLYHRRKRSAPEFIIFTLCQSITRESRMLHQAPLGFRLTHLVVLKVQVFFCLRLDSLYLTYLASAALRIMNPQQTCKHERRSRKALPPLFLRNFSNQNAKCKTNCFQVLTEMPLFESLQ